MIKKKLHIQLFDINLLYLEMEEGDKPELAMRYIKKFNLNANDEDEIYNNLNFSTDGGEFIYNFVRNPAILILIYPTEKRTKIVSHEIRHAVDKMIKHYNINDVETPAYLTGVLSEFLLK